MTTYLKSIRMVTGIIIISELAMNCNIDCCDSRFSIFNTKGRSLKKLKTTQMARMTKSNIRIFSFSAIAIKTRLNNQLENNEEKLEIFQNASSIQFIHHGLHI